MLTARDLSLATALTLFTACDAEPFGAEEDVELRCGEVGNNCPPVFNTPFNGSTYLSPLATDGGVLEGVQVVKVVLPDDVLLLDFWAKKGQLFGTDGETDYEGTDFSGAAFHLLVAGEPVVLRLVTATPPPLGEPFWRYLFTWEAAGLPPSTLACEPADGGDLNAIVHEDLMIDPRTGAVSYRADTVYIACLRGAAGEVAYKPIGYGFRPFEVGLAGFQAAMHFVRADYCGNGETWTKFGEEISYTDKYGIAANIFAGTTDAVWGLHGAVCIGAELRDDHTYEDIICDNIAKPPKCTDAEAQTQYLTAGRIWSKVAP